MPVMVRQVVLESQGVAKPEVRVTPEAVLETPNEVPLADTREEPASARDEKDPEPGANLSFAEQATRCPHKYTDAWRSTP